MNIHTIQRVSEGLPFKKKKSYLTLGNERHSIKDLRKDQLSFVILMN